MSASGFSKSACQSCAVHLEYPVEAEGAHIACPQCGQQTQLLRTPVPEAQPAAPALTLESLDAAFTGPVARTPVSFFYRLGLLVVTLAMVTLPLIYLAMIGAAGWAVYYWATHFTFLLASGGSGRVWLFKLLCYITPLFAGAVLVFFMIKPLFARRAPHAQPLALNPGAEPFLFAFVTKLCQTVGAPFPTRIDIDCQLNASASFRRGAFSLLGNDLVLTIGLPLVAGLNLREFAGVLAHEFGHFTQGFGMRLTYVIRTVNGWFARVVYERDVWDLMLEEAAQTEDCRVAIFIGMARVGVWLSRQLLTLLMLIGHGIGCFMLRQMEYDADSYEIKLAGSAAFENTMRRIQVLGATLERTHKDMRTSWNLNKRLPDDFPAYFLEHARQISERERTRLEDTMGLEPSGIFDTHPSNGDRIRRARQAGEPGVFDLDAPAAGLFSNFEIPAKQVTVLYYDDDLGIPVELAKLVPVETKSAALPDEEPSGIESAAVAPTAPAPGDLRIRRNATGEG
jgi:Zn-dependent protease with chaperone function